MILCSSGSLQDKENCRSEGETEQQTWRTVEDDEEDRKFWEEPTPYTPESRLETHRYIEEKRKAKEQGDVTGVSGFCTRHGDGIH